MSSVFSLVVSNAMIIGLSGWGFTCVISGLSGAQLLMLAMFGILVIGICVITWILCQFGPLGPSNSARCKCQSHGSSRDLSSYNGSWDYAG